MDCRSILTFSKRSSIIIISFAELILLSTRLVATESILLSGSLICSNEFFTVSKINPS